MSWRTPLKAKRFESHDDFFASFFSLVKQSGDEVITLFEKKNEERNTISMYGRGNVPN